jgi:pyrroloquinoline quinone biosynthesis protein D
MDDRPLAPPDRPRLTAKARLRQDAARGGTVLLYPEGVLLLNPTAAAVLALCDGRRTAAAIAAELAGRYQASTDAVEADVTGLLGRLRGRGLVFVPDGEGDA